MSSRRRRPRSQSPSGVNHPAAGLPAVPSPASVPKPKHGAGRGQRRAAAAALPAPGLGGQELYALSPSNSTRSKCLPGSNRGELFVKLLHSYGNSGQTVHLRPCSKADAMRANNRYFLGEDYSAGSPTPSRETRAGEPAGD